jgi:hypothetical protein
MNLDDLDREVRDSLLGHADDAPSGAGTLDAVRTRSHRLKVRRRAGLAGVAAVVAVAAAAGTPYVLTATGPARVSVGSGPGASTTTATPANFTKIAQAVLLNPRFVLPSRPYP